MRTMAVLMFLVLPALADPDWQGTIRTVQKEMGEGFRVERVGRFVVATDAGDALYASAKASLSRCGEALFRDYFETEPPHVLIAYLFEGAESYEAYVLRRFGHKATTPYGFYSDSSRSLVMNISTGTGTLVHEMIHAFTAVDFPEMPAWFNEGLGSLHEQCASENGSLKGLVNWRLPILQEALKGGTCPSWEDLIGMSDRAFYSEGRGANYAAARYLCLWLQEKGLLIPFYKKFRDGAKDDPSGWRTFQSILPEPLAESEAAWRKWAAKLAWK